MTILMFQIIQMLKINIPDNTCTPKSSHIVPDSSQNVVVESRPVRVRKMPAKYDDFFVG